MTIKIIKTKEEFINFLEDLPEGGYTWLNECYTDEEESCYNGGGNFRDRDSIILQVWEGNIKFNMDNVVFEIPDDEAIEIIESYIV